MEHVTTELWSNELYGNWPQRLNHQRKILELPNGETLNRKDLYCLHLAASGLPRRMMAERMFVSVKAIEKRLTKCRDLLYCPQRPNDTLLMLLNSWQLLPFLISQEDWFQATENARDVA